MISISGDENPSAFQFNSIRSWQTAWKVPMVGRRPTPRSRSFIWRAASLVNVRPSTRLGLMPLAKVLRTASVSTLVLPDPGLATTNSARFSVIA
ncbi:MAG: hypothetical protein KJZ65_02210 [Phycisphaerales bacterium]|nr:hypothetical protein [Phycisphaerales bacterium]